MKICLDVQSAISQRAGVGRYTRMLSEHLAATLAPDELRLFAFDFRRQADTLDVPTDCLRLVRWCPGRLAQLAWKTVGAPPFDMFAGKADLYHFPNFILPPLSKGRTVVTIHDMSFERFPEFAESRNLCYLSSRIRDTVNRADAIITDSAFSAAEIQELLDITPDRLHPIHLGINPDLRAAPAHSVQATRETLGLDGPYLLAVGTIEPRKNLSFMVDAFERMTTFDGTLVIAGMHGWKFEPILDRIRSSSRADRIRVLDYLDDEMLAPLYTGAELFVTTSLYEGFGLPPLEAMACGTPVLSSTGGSLPEVLGPAATLLDPTEPDRWAEEAARLLTDSGHRAAQVAEGTARAAQYTWQETARKTLAVYREAGS